jgi:hypothetical protein
MDKEPRRRKRYRAHLGNSARLKTVEIQQDNFRILHVLRDRVSQFAEIRRKVDVVLQDQCCLEAIVEHSLVNTKMTQCATNRSWTKRATANNGRVNQPRIRKIQISAIDGGHYVIRYSSLAKLSHDVCSPVRRSGQINNISLHLVIYLHMPQCSNKVHVGLVWTNDRRTDGRKGCGG